MVTLTNNDAACDVDGITVTGLPEGRTDTRTLRAPQEPALAASREAPAPSGRISPFFGKYFNPM